MERSSALKYKRTVLLLALFIGSVSAENVHFGQDPYLVSANETTTDTPRPMVGFVTVTCFHTLDNSTSNITYQLTTSDPMFSLNETSGALMAEMNLDYETATSYELIVQCQSGLNVSWIDEAAINITVLPINEYRPTISTSSEVVAIPEGTALGTVIFSTLPGGLLRYTVADQDDGPGGDIYFTAVIMDDIENSFAFNDSVGAVYLVQTFDLDSDMSVFRRVVVVITVCDSSPPTLDCLNIDLTIILTPGNDNTPSFIETSLNVSFPETTNLSTVIAQVECLDADFSVGALAGYEIVNVSPSETPVGTFQINRTGAIVIDMPLDYELTDQYELEVRCFDSGSPTALEDFATVEVDVSAANDNRPTFLNASVNVTYPESVETLTVITEVECSDIDILVGEFAGYEIVSVSPSLTPAGTFVLNGTAIELGLQLDFELTNEYEIEIRCFDSGFPVLDDFATIRVSVEAVNDNVPSFLTSLLNVSYPESVAVTTVVAQTDCVDGDLAVGALAGYEIVSILPSQTPAGTFLINETGAISVGIELDFESTEEYELEVRCFDSGVPALEDFATVRVRVSDVNDNSPVCSPVPNKILSTGTHSHENIVTLNCTDRDSGLNAELRYTFADAPELDVGEFLLNPITGELTFLGTINMNRNYTISVLVSDRGNASRSTNLSFQVSVEGTVTSPAILLPLWAIIVIVVACLLLICCLLICLMCCCHCCFRRRRGKKAFASETVSEDNDKDLVIAQYPLDRRSPEPDRHVELNNSYKDYVLHFKTTALDDSSTCPTTPTSTSSDNEEEGVVYTSSTQVILNPSANAVDSHSPDAEDSPLEIENSPPEVESGPPDVTITVETPDIGLRTPGMDHSRDMLIITSDEDEEITGM